MKSTPERPPLPLHPLEVEAQHVPDVQLRPPREEARATPERSKTLDFFRFKLACLVYYVNRPHAGTSTIVPDLT
jgi:hypothetical protein